MDEKHFEELWEQEERQGLQRRLQQEYPAWQQRRRVRRTALASVAMVLVAGITLSTFHFPLSTRNYDSVACNRNGIDEGHWATEASRILTIETI